MGMGNSMVPHSGIVVCNSHILVSTGAAAGAGEVRTPGLVVCLAWRRLIWGTWMKLSTSQESYWANQGFVE